MRYQIRAVEDRSLPAGTDWAWARVPDGLYLFVKRSRFADPDCVTALLSRAFQARMTVEGDPVGRYHLAG